MGHFEISKIVNGSTPVAEAPPSDPGHLPGLTGAETTAIDKQYNGLNLFVSCITRAKTIGSCLSRFTAQAETIDPMEYIPPILCT